MTTKYTERSALVFGAVELVLTFMTYIPPRRIPPRSSHALTLSIPPEEHERVRHKWLLAFAEQWKENIVKHMEDEFVEDTVNVLFAGEPEEFSEFVASSKPYFEGLHRVREQSAQNSPKPKPAETTKQWWWLW